MDTLSLGFQTALEIDLFGLPPPLSLFLTPVDAGAYIDFVTPGDRLNLALLDSLQTLHHNRPIFAHLLGHHGALPFLFLISIFRAVLFSPLHTSLDDLLLALASVSLLGLAILFLYGLADFLVDQVTVQFLQGLKQTEKQERLTLPLTGLK